MDAARIDIQGLRVPAEEGAIAQALAALDETMARWAAAMHEACERFAAPAAPPQASSTPLPEEPTGPEVVAQSPQDESAAIAPPPPAVEAEPALSEPAVAEPASSCAVCTEPTASQEMSDRPEDPTASAAPAEDEALLASLDAETARAIRVMRRLSPVPRAVRELLQEYEANRPSSPPAGQTRKRSWFSRGS